MTTMTIRNLDEAFMVRLRQRAAEHGRSMEEEALDILRDVPSTEARAPVDLGRAIQTRFAALGCIDLAPTPRQPIRDSTCSGS
jgi:plasmid stability protein